MAWCTRGDGWGTECRTTTRAPSTSRRLAALIGTPVPDADAAIGTVAVFAEQGRRLTPLGQAVLAPKAHSVAVDPRTHLVYFPLERGSGGKPELLIMAPA